MIGMDEAVATMILAAVAVVTLVYALFRDRRSDVTKALERIEGDVKELGGEVRKLTDRLGAVETRLAVVETHVNDLRRPLPPEPPAPVPPPRDGAQ